MVWTTKVTMVFGRNGPAQWNESMQAKKTKRKAQTKRLILGAPGLTTRSTKLLGAPGIATRSKDATTIPMDGCIYASPGRSDPP